MINGSPTDPSAGDYKKGAHQVFDKSGVKIAKEYDTPDWSPDKAQQETEQALTAVGEDNVAGVYSANDGMAGGAIAAMKGAASIRPTCRSAAATPRSPPSSGSSRASSTPRSTSRSEAGRDGRALAVAMARGEKAPPGS